MLPRSSSSYPCVTSNSFNNEHITEAEDFYNESDFAPQPLRKVVQAPDTFLDQGSANENPRPTYRHNGMSQSLSEGNLEFRSHNAQRRAGQTKHRRLASDEIPIRRSEDTAISSSPSRGAVSSSSSRGRNILRTPSPFKLEDIEEASRSVEELAKFPPQRSRSPMKQLFGEHGWLGQSMSTKDFPSEGHRKKPGLKEWGGKLKQRVEHLVGLPVSDLLVAMLLTFCRLQTCPKSTSQPSLRASSLRQSPSPDHHPRPASTSRFHHLSKPGYNLRWNS